jgi:predicted AAA+ superfamily ATPase
MYRIAIEKLLKWKQSKRRKPLIIEGARQVGKTWLMKEFGKQAYTDAIYILTLIPEWQSYLLLTWILTA